MFIGWTLRNKKLPRTQLSHTISCVIMAMMMLIGVEMGGSESVLSAFGTIFMDAVILTIGAVGGTLTLALLVNRFILKTKADHVHKDMKKSSHVFSFMIVGVFGLGVLIGYFRLLPHLAQDASMWALYLLMALVGFNIGSDTAALKALRTQPWKVIFVPMATIVGTLVGVAALSPLVEFNIFDQFAIGSGFGYYSLSSVLLSELRGVELGAIALMVNVMRELITVVFAPLFVRYFSPLSVICSGGATTLDVTLPVVINNCGSSFIGIALFQGVIVDLSVPFLVTMFASINKF